MSMLDNNPIQIVDENDTPVGSGTMDDAQLQGLWHRIAGVVVQDKKTGEFLLQKVAANPWYSGGLWSITATGHVDAGESYHVAAARELYEEMGLQGLELVEFSYYHTERQGFVASKDRIYRRFYKIFFAQADKSTLTVVPEPAEVEDYAWTTIEQLRSDDMPTTNTLKRFIEEYVKSGQA